MSESDPTLLLRDRLEILELEGAYARTFDSHDGQGWASLFTESGVYQGVFQPGMPEPVAPIKGRVALAAACDDFPLSMMHLLGAPQITLDGDRAEGRINFESRSSRVDEHGNFHQMHIVAYYHAAYVRTPEGWRIQNRVTVPFKISTSTECGYQGSIELPGPDA